MAVALATLTVSCGTVVPHERAALDVPVVPAATSLDGRALVAPVPDADTARARARATADARARYAAHPDDEDAIIWYGRRLAYEYRYAEAVAVFDEGLARHPDSVRLLRHRGHRHITLRDFARAAADLERASRLSRDMPDEIEPDGAPNAAGIPRSTLRSNIEYHLGLARVLQGDFEAARAAYERGLVLSQVNDDMLVATSWWAWLTLRRLGRDEEAAALLEPVHADMEILENHAYHRLLLMARGELEPDALLAEAGDGVQDATVGYGVAAFLLVQGQGARAEALWRRIVAGPAWMAFGHIAAEAELARARTAGQTDA